MTKWKGSTVIVVEGMDNTGKTTLVKRLEERLGFRRVKSPGPGEEKDLKGWVLNDGKVALEKDTIYDRHSLISEEVYGPVLRGSSAFDQEDWQKLWTWFLDQLSPIIIYCRPPREEVLRTIREREQMEGVERNCSLLLDEYTKFFRQEVFLWHHRFYIYDFTVDPMARDLFTTLKAMEGLKL